MTSLTGTRIQNRTAFLGLVALLAVAGGTAFYPGVLTFDSTRQLMQARLGVYDDMHPPVMAALWHLLLPIQDSAFPMLLLQILMYWGAIATLGLTFLPSFPRLAYLFAALWAVPPVMAMTGTIWTDSGLAASWLLAAALAARYHVLGRRPPPAATAAMIAGFLYGIGVRYNAVAGGWPLLLLILTAHLRPAPGQRYLMRAGLMSLALTVVAFGGMTLLNDSLATHKRFAAQHLLIKDLSCLSAHFKKPLFPDYITKNPAFSFEQAYAQYYERRAPTWQLAFVTGDPQQMRELRSYWLRTIRRYPEDYLYCRIKDFNLLFRAGEKAIHPYELNDLSYKTGPDRAAVTRHAAGLAYRYLDAMRQSPVNKPCYWALLGLTLLAANGWRAKKKRLPPPLALPIFCLIASSLMYFAAYLLINIGDDVRFVYWPIVALLVALALTLVPRQMAMGHA